MSSIIGEHHLAEALGLRLGAAAELDLVELADAVDEQRRLLRRTRSSMSSSDASVSSTTSCRIAAAIAWRRGACRRVPGRPATGWEMYGSPVLRVWPSWAFAPNS